MGRGEVLVLGPVEVVGDDGPIQLAGKQVRLLAALLVADGRACDLDELVEAVWDGSAPASARKLVQVYVSQLRKSLPADVEIATLPGGYAVSLDPELLDSTRFEQLLGESAEARAAGNPALALSLVERALDLWRGRAYGELAYEEFARPESDRLEELHVVAAETRLGAQLELGRHTDVLAEALKHAQQHVLRDSAQELAMLALYRSGRQTDALDQYTRYRARLVEELGLEPGAPLRDLQRRILEQDTTLDVPVTAGAASALRSPPNPLVGRERELAALRTLLERRESRLLVLTGAGGSGKTRLALELARLVADGYANGLVLVELAPLRDDSLVLPAIAHALEIGIETDGDVLEAVAEALGSQELLLVLDNAEHVRHAAPAYAELVARAPRLTLLITSRAVLHVSGEHVVPVAPLDEDAAVELFVQRASALGTGFALSAANDDDVRGICRRVDGLPLAIELAAARIGTLTPSALLARLDARLGLLTGGPRDLPARQRTLRGTIDWSVDLLAERARSVFARIAVFPAGASLAAAEHVCGAGVDTLGELVDHHLLRRVDAGDEPRFGMLETVREYALDALGESRRATEVAMARFYADLTDRVETEARSSAGALGVLDPELDNVRTALAVCESYGEPELQLRLAGNMWRYCWVRGSSGEGLAWITRALDGDGRATLARARALQGAAGLSWSLGNFDQAKELARAAIPVAAEVGSLWDEMAANTVLGVVANNEEDREAARVHHRRSMQLAEQAGLEPFAQKLNLGIIALDDGEFAEARVLLEDVLETHRRSGNVQGMGFALLNLGVVYHSLGEHPLSFETFREAGERFGDVGFRAHVAHALQGIAAFEASEGRFSDAARLLGQARAELDEVGSPEGDFASDMVAWTKERAREGLGADSFQAAYEAGREGA